MSLDAPFVFVQNDPSGTLHKREHAHDRVVTLGQQHPTFTDFLGVSDEALNSLVYPDTGAPIFRTGYRRYSGAYMTTTSITTILNEEGIPTIGILDTDLAAGKAALADSVARSAIGLGISTTFVFDPRTIGNLVNKARLLAPNCPVILGGAGITLNPHWFAETGADYAVLSDAERALPALIRCIRSGGNLADVPGLVYRDAVGQVHCTEIEPVANLDKTPTLRWDLTTNGSWPPVVWYESLRGCPFRCKFCSYPNQSPVWRKKSAEHMANEFSYFADKGVRYICCYDSTILTPLHRMKEFTKLLIDRGQPVRWECWGHPAQLQSEDLCRSLFDAGCVLLAMGVESGSETVLANMSKKISRDKAATAVRNVKQAGLLCTCHYFVGFPGETRETVRETHDFIKQTEPDGYVLEVFQLRDKTIPVLQEAEKHGLTYDENAEGFITNWKHNTMDMDEAKVLAQELVQELTNNAPRTLHSQTLIMSGVRYEFARNAAQAEYRRQRLNPILKELERHVAASSGQSIVEGDGTLACHRARARKLLRAELDSGSIQSREPIVFDEDTGVH